MMNSPTTILAVASLAIVALFVASGAAWIQIVRQIWQSEPVLPKRFRADEAYVPRLAFVLVMAYVAFGLSHILSNSAPADFQVEQVLRGVQASIFEGVLGIGLLLLIILLGVNKQTDYYRLGFRLDALPAQIADGLRGMIVAILPVFLVMLLTLPFRSVETTHPFLRLVDERGFGNEFLLVTFAAVIIAPLKEELMFRVILQSQLVRWMGVIPAIWLTALLFATVHGFPDSIALIPLALILGAVYQWRRSFLSIVLIHALFNAFNLGLVLLQQSAETILPPEVPLQ